ncbi:MAG: low molecular weight protein-tyrosine-phosphatase [Alphaproteobacteria bacterium]|nr:low molecular weight protein-tyrosine-phosphatase [Alphaproteobacteria bacterium]
MTVSVRVLFVCTGNICRSPTAEGLFRAHVEQAGLAHRIEADSAGTHGYHVGEPPDARSRQAALARGVDIGGQRARRIDPSDFYDFDLILAMDRGHLRQLEGIAPRDATARLHLFLDFAPERGPRDVPDPYYSGAGAFEQVLDLVEDGVLGLISHLRDSRL